MPEKRLKRDRASTTITMRIPVELLALGAYPDITLKRAREKRDEARRRIADGIDPNVQRKAERSAQAETFEAVAIEWLELQKKSLACETMLILGTRLKSFLYPYIGNRPVASITAQELLAVLRRIEARGRHETAHRVRALAGRVLRYAAATGRAQHDIAADLKDALASVKSRNFASVTEPRRVGELMRAIDSHDRHPVNALALKLAPLVFGADACGRSRAQMAYSTKVSGSGVLSRRDVHCQHRLSWSPVPMAGRPGPGLSVCFGLWTCSGSRRRERESSTPPRLSSRPRGSRWRALCSRQDWS
jgi:Phage integrase central domain/Arm DNA-binding domain